MEETMLAIKAIMFIAMEGVVIGVIAAVLIAGVYQIVRDKVREARQRDEIVQEEEWLKHTP